MAAITDKRQCKLLSTFLKERTATAFLLFLKTFEGNDLFNLLSPLTVVNGRINDGMVLLFSIDQKESFDEKNGVGPLIYAPLSALAIVLKKNDIVLPDNIRKALTLSGILWIQQNYSLPDASFFTNSQGVLDRDKWDSYLNREQPFFVKSKSGNLDNFIDHAGNTKAFARGWVRKKELLEYIPEPLRQGNQPIFIVKNSNFETDIAITCQSIFMACFGHLIDFENENCFFKLAYEGQILPNILQTCMVQGQKFLDDLPVKSTMDSLPETRPLLTPLENSPVESVKPPAKKKQKFLPKFAFLSPIPPQKESEIISSPKKLGFHGLLDKFPGSPPDERTIRRNSDNYFKETGKKLIGYDEQKDQYWFFKSDLDILTRCNPNIGRPPYQIRRRLIVNFPLQKLPEILPKN